jgi:branched-chain amino acid transport system substrate-binding protein
MRRHRVWSCFAFLFLVLLATGWARAEDGVTPTEILLGSSAAYHGPSAFLGVSQWRGFTAYFNQVNASGGIHGRKIRVIAYDDEYEPLYSVANTLKLIEKDKVFALFGYVGTPTLVRALPVLARYQDSGVFLFSNFTGAQPQREPPYDKLVFNVRASYREETAGLVEHLVKLGYKRIGAFVQDDAYGKSGEEGLERALAPRDLHLVSVARYQRGMRFNEPAHVQVQQLMAAKADVVVAVGAYAGCAAFIRDARLAGFEGPIANVSFVGPDALLELLIEFESQNKKTITRRLINSQVVPNWNDSEPPILKEYRQAMDKLGNTMPQVPSATGKPTVATPRRYSFGSLEGYLNAKLLVEILRKVGPELTRARFRTVAESMPPVDLGLGVPLGFSTTNHQALHQVWYTIARDGRWVDLTNWSTALK